jgi:hypothetical protein
MKDRLSIFTAREPCVSIMLRPRPVHLHLGFASESESILLSRREGVRAHSHYSIIHDHLATGENAEALRKRAETMSIRVGGWCTADVVTVSIVSPYPGRA